MRDILDYFQAFSVGIRRNRFVRGLYYYLNKLGAWFPNRRKMAHCANNVIIIPPFNINGYKNISIGECVYFGPQANISAINAKFICKGHCAIAEGLTVHTGNHARVVGKFLTELSCFQE